MKKLLSLALSAVFLLALSGFEPITATELTENIRMGWNLGNTLDARGYRYGFSWLGGGYYANTTVEEMETACVSHQATQELIDAVFDAGFDTLRIPVSWFKAADEEYNIREDWMERVYEVVNFAVENDMYIILNSHHDEYIFSLLDDYMDETIIAFTRIWEQIAYTFRYHSEKLIFQGMNEPRTRFTPAEWNGGTAEERNNLNILNQLFVDIIRNSGGYNPYRVLMVPTYAASMAAVAQRNLVVPTDTIEDRIIVTMHSYAPVNFALMPNPAQSTPNWSASNPSDTLPITNQMDLAYEIFVSQGIPVVLTEMGTINRDNIRARADWTTFFITEANRRGMPTVWWDNGNHEVSGPNPWGGYNETFGLFDRGTAELIHPEIIEAIDRAFPMKY